MAERSGSKYLIHSIHRFCNSCWKVYFSVMPRSSYALPDMSQLHDLTYPLPGVLKAAKTEEHHETPKKDSEPDFRRLYSYLVNLLESNISPDLPPAESEVIIILLKDLAQVVKYPLLQEEKEFLRSKLCSKLENINVV
ncbi:uncharacterized protein LOC143242616 [Tachypleus tridentatus]|uniref:uncharacterized protein LOC143242616 n=1 Tax=Tachypleus tridentatus TaxID=6853 RepID=UPI003FD3CD85